ncbi:MAG: hypothetical protein KBS79_03525 [Lachnospiraceae bacterium]|nr:hypothetical protein [Candidatus Minthocola equi]
MTKGFMKKKYNSVFWAFLLAWIISMLGTLTDSIFAGQFISEEAVAATELVAPLLSFVNFFAILLGAGASTRYSYYAGAFDFKKAYRLSGTALLFSLIYAALFALFLFLFKDTYFSFFSAAPEIEALAREYYSSFYIIAVVAPPGYLIYSLACMDGDSTIVLISDALSATLNPVFSIILVQKIGVFGLGLGTALSLVLSYAVVISHFFTKRNSIHFKLCMDFKYIKESVVFGSSGALALLYTGIVDIVFNKFIIVQYGALYLSAYTIVNLILNMAAIAKCGADAASSFVGVGFGEKNNTAIKVALKISAKRTIIIGIIMTIIFLGLSGVFPDIYGLTTPELREISTDSARILSFYLLLVGFGYVWSTYLPLIGKPLLANVISCLYTLVLPIALGMTCGSLFGFSGMVWGLMLVSVVGLIVTVAIIWIKYGRDKVPHALNDYGNTIFMHEFSVNDEEIHELQKILGDEMSGFGLSASLINKIQLMVEETFEIVKAENQGKKKILADCSVIIDDKYVRLVTRDNGKVFDITKVGEKTESLGHYVLARMIDNLEDSAYTTSISFNRNSFVWER